MTIDLASLGWDAELASAYGRIKRADTYPARVVRWDGGIATLLGSAGAGRASLGGGMLAHGGRDPSRLPCLGDWVVARVWPDRQSTVEAVLPRRNRLHRMPVRTRSRLAAANVDHLVLAPGIWPDRTGWLEERLDWSQACGLDAVIASGGRDRLWGRDRRDAVAAEKRGLDRLRALATGGRTVGIVGGGRTPIVTALVGAVPIPRPGRPVGSLLVMAGGGAVLDLPDEVIVDATPDVGELSSSRPG
jgi:ribosome biogenesis GTPase / thiamine phosphate phosphatase